MAKRKDPIQETGKFVLRIAVFLLPLIVNHLTNAGYLEEAAIASAVLTVVDKYWHESSLPGRGLLPF